MEENLVRAQRIRERQDALRLLGRQIRSRFHTASADRKCDHSAFAVSRGRRDVPANEQVPMNRHSETAFETVIEAHLLSRGYVTVERDGFDAARAIFPQEVLAFIRVTQPAEWAKLEALHGVKTGEQVLADLCKWMDTNGSLATLRHGFKCYGRTLHVAYFKAAHELNPELEARYAANRLGLTRQLHFSARSEKSLDVTVSLNGIPVATAELKNPLTGQRVDD